MLDGIGGYRFESRGQMTLKGKTEPIRTFWLVGETEHRKHRRRQNLVSERDRNSLTNILFSQKLKSEKASLTSDKNTRCQPNEAMSGQLCGHYWPLSGRSETSLKPLNPILERTQSTTEFKEEPNNEWNQLSLKSSRSQYSLNLISCPLTTNRSDKCHNCDDCDVLKPPPYKTVSSAKESESDRSKKASNGFRRLDIRDRIVFQRASSLSRSESLPQMSDRKIRVPSNVV